MTLKIYADRISQPTRAVILFCKLNAIDFEEIRVDLSKHQHSTPQFEEINPLMKVPAIVDGRFRLFESHAILVHLASVYPGVADHWYPADVFKRVKIHSLLDWHHLNLHWGSGGYVFNSITAPKLGQPLNPRVADDAKKVLSASLATIECVWLKGSGPFLLGSFQPSIADLSFVCEIMQLELLDEKEREQILGPHKRLLKWIDDTKDASKPHFDQVHSFLFKVKENFKKQRSAKALVETGPVRKTHHSNM